MTDGATRCAHEDLVLLCASVPAVDPTITAAWITAGVGAAGIAGTVVTAIVGSRNTRMATERTITAGTATTTATLAAAREDRLWEKRCAVYEEILAAMAHRQSQLNDLLKRGRLEDASEQEVALVFHSYGSRDWAATQGRLLAYASDAVRDVSGTAVQAAGMTRERYRDVGRAQDRVNSAARSPAAGENPLTEAVRALNDAFTSASRADKALIDTIRDELRSRPEAATLPATVPAERRRIWKRASWANRPAPRSIRVGCRNGGIRHSLDRYRP